MLEERSNIQFHHSQLNGLNRDFFLVTFNLYEVVFEC